MQSFAPSHQAPRVVAGGDPSRTVWFLDSLVTFQVYRDECDAGLSVMRLRARQGHAPPWHVHHTEDEIFHVVSGRVRFRIGDAVLTAGAGETLVGPRGVPHGYIVESAEMEMLVLASGGFERMVRAMSRRPEHDGLPDPMVPTPAQQAALVAACKEQDIDIIGPPLT